jgi:Lamin Tail Domain
MTKKIFWTLLFFIFPLSTNAQVLFSEIAWMGTADDANNEWIELFNHGQESVSVDGWTLTDGNALNIALVGTIAPQTIVVLERTDDTTLPSITAFQIYTGALANDGRTLTLKRADGAVEDQAIGGDAWGSIGGSNETKETPQRAMTTWVTGVPTPGAQNVTHDSGTNQQTTNNTNQNTTQNTNTTNTSVQKTKSGGGSNKGSKVPLVPGVLSLSIDAPEIAYVNQQVTNGSWKNTHQLTWIHVEFW